jgi:serine/threonine protein phosphatase PrpC
MHCAACAADVPDDDLFCENCGQRLGASPPLAQPPECACSEGGASVELDEEGFCLRCGRRVRRPAPDHAEDHVEQSLSPTFAAVSDRGIRHERNEDRFSLYRDEGAYAIAVCDGVSATRNAELASSSVAEAVQAALAEAIGSGNLKDREQLMRQAIAAGAACLTANAGTDGNQNSPSTTVVAALVADGVATIGWVGDSRAYWIDASRALPLTRDHSWLEEALAEGRMTAEEARASPNAHAITRWIGSDAGESAEPDCVRYTIPGAGLLLLCSDGLWNYAPTPEALAKLVLESSVGEKDGLALAKRLVQFANRQGGQDNITVAVLQLPAITQPR